MRFLTLEVCFVFLLLFLMSCNKPTMEEDAQKAAELSSLSTQRVKENDLFGSEKYYRDAQRIIDQYRSTPQFEEFYNLYNAYLEVKVYKKMEPYIQEQRTQEE